MNADNSVDQRYEPLARRLHAAWSAGVSTWEQDESIQPAFYRQAATVAGGEAFQAIGDAVAEAAGDFITTWPPGLLAKITKAVHAALTLRCAA